jgi:hypothetical protein
MELRMKHAPEKILLTIAVAAMAVGVAPLACAQPASGPRAGTVEAMQCLTRQGPKGCEKMFVGRAWPAARPWVFENPNRDFKRGPLISSEYWGRASKTNAFDAKILVDQPTNEMDIFDVKFAHIEYSFYISPADGEGKVQALAIRLYGPHDLHQLEH